MMIQFAAKNSTAVLACYFDSHGYNTNWQEYRVNITDVSILC
jgi:hypothetical protein